MRTVKTAVAVAICALIFLPFAGFSPTGSSKVTDQIGPFYACIAAVVCMQGSVDATWRQGLSRLLGTLIGGLLGLLGVTIAADWTAPLAEPLLCGLGVLLAIYLCTLFRQPKACAIAAIVTCAVMLTHSGQERYFYTVARMAETAAGILVAMVVNRVLPSRKESEQQKTATST
jgi:uncharacterized membrane protein YgaE (UPF0421/DUF939 family)